VDLIPPMGIRVAFKTEWSRQLNNGYDPKRVKRRTADKFRVDEVELVEVMTSNKAEEVEDEEGGHETKMEEEEPVVPMDVEVVPSRNQSKQRGQIRKNQRNDEMKHFEEDMEYKANALALPQEPRHEDSFASRGPDEEPKFSSGGISGYGDGMGAHDGVMLQHEPRLQSGSTGKMSAFSQHDGPGLQHDGGAFGGGMSGQSAVDIQYMDSDHSDDDQQMYGKCSGRRRTLGGPARGHQE